MSDLSGLESRPLLPALALAWIAVLLLSLVVLYFRHRAGGKGTLAGKAQAKGLAAETGSDASKPRVLVLFGTQTGTAERFSKQLKTELQTRYGGASTYDVMDLEDFSGPDQLPKEKVVFFMVATYGDGEPTDNAADFYNWVVKAGGEAEKGTGNAQLLKDVSFGVFGLGNKQYEHFCAVGKRMHRALAALGATPLVNRGEGDDDDDIEADFEAWRTDLFQALDKATVMAKADGPPGVTQVVAAADSVPCYDVEVLTGADADAADAEAALSGALSSGDGTAAGSLFAARVAVVRELHTPASARSCLHVELDVSGSGITYEAGDHVGVSPENGPEVVERAAHALGLPLDTVFRLRVPEGNAHQLHAPPACAVTLRGALARHADLLGPVSKQALQALAAFASGAEAARLRRLVSPAGAAEYKAWHCQSRSLLEVLEEFPGVRPPLGAFFGAICGRLQTRFYSISSSPLPHPASVHITCAVVDDVTPTGRPHAGICSHFFMRCSIGARVPVWVRRSAFRLPKDPSAPLVMVGPGTGLAPFRGFLQEREALAQRGVVLGVATLFFGCRARDQDYIYAAELAEFVRSGTLSALHVAFSREGADKDYVQHHMAREAAAVAELLMEEGAGHLYVCGDAKHMAKDVQRELARIVAERQGLSMGEAEAVLVRLAAAGRIQKDIW